MAIDIEKLCADAESCIGKARYCDDGQSECLTLSGILAGKPTMCDGFIIALFGAQGYGLNGGTNTIWRNSIGECGSISDGKPSDPYPQHNPLRSSQLQRGMLVFKWTRTGCKNANHEKDGKGNYLHIGIVTHVSPLRIVHCSSENSHQGIVVDTKIGKWCAWGWEKRVDHNTDHDDRKEETGMYKLKIKATPSLRVRTEPNLDGDKITALKTGTIVHADIFDGAWYHLPDYEGWVAGGKYVEVLTEAAEEDRPADAKYMTKDEVTALVRDILIEHGLI